MMIEHSKRFAIEADLYLDGSPVSVLSSLDDLAEKSHELAGKYAQLFRLRSNTVDLKTEKPHLLAIVLNELDSDDRVSVWVECTPRTL